ncbi:MAG: ATPase, T2SS/T4P/T4SS family [Phycisphaeraceae bacterium]
MYPTIAQLQAEPLFLMSIAKPILMLLVLGPWAWVVGRLDKDAGYYYIKQNQWALAHLAAGFLGFGVMLVVPIFWIGWPLGMLILAGEIYAYIAYRNGQVPEKERWSAADIVKGIQAEGERKAGEKAKQLANVKLMDKSEQLLDVPHGDDPRTPAFDLFQNMLVFAVPRGADQLEMTVDAEKAVFVARIDGIRYPQEAPGKDLCLQLIRYLKEHAGMDVEENRRKQTGKMWVEVEDYGKHTLQLTTAGSTRALQLIIEIDPDGRLDIPLKALGLLKPQYDKVQELVQDLTKVVVFSSPPRTGTTTTMYAMLQAHDPYTSSVMTFEKKKAFEVEGVNHNEFPEGASNEQIMEQFGALLRADPNVMMISQVLNTDMAQLIARQSEDTRFYLPLPARDTLSSLKLWMKVVGDRRLAAESLGAIVSQRLVRKLCHTCRAPYTPDAAAMKKLNIAQGSVTQLYKASGKVMVKDEAQPCPDCHGLGYRGRVGVYEIMFIDREARSLIASGEGDRLKAHLRKQRMVYLQEAALAKVVEGVSDIKEVTRVMAEHKKG